MTRELVRRLLRKAKVGGMGHSLHDASAPSQRLIQQNTFAAGTEGGFVFGPWSDDLLGRQARL